MKIVIIIIISCIFTANVHAQSNFYKDSSLLSLKGNQNLLHSFNFSAYQNHNPIVPDIKNLKLTDASVLRLPEPVLTYVGKSNHLEIYKSTPDNMYVAKPDSTLIYSMPVAEAR